MLMSKTNKKNDKMNRPCEPIIDFIKVGVRGLHYMDMLAWCVVADVFWNVLGNRIALNHWGQNGAGE